MTDIPHTLSPYILKQIALKNQFKVLQVLYTVGYGFMFGLSLACVIYLRWYRSTAYQGDSEAARKIILPSFEPLIWVMCIVTGAYTFYFIVATAFNYTEPIFNNLFTESLYEGRQFIMFVILAFLFQRSVTRPALIRSMAISFTVAAIPMIFTAVMNYMDAAPLTALLVPLIYRMGLAIFLLWLCFRPIGRANQRALREFCGFILGYYVLVFVYTELFFLGLTTAGIVLVFVTVAYASAAPFVVYRLLRADTQHWRGLGERACDLQQVFRQNQCMQEIVSAQGLHVLLEMHQRDIIDFAHLELQQKIGIGASADVFKGSLNSSVQVAVKVYSPNEITESTIVDFSQEAALCSALKHPNVVTFHGMCVCPPTICLVSELCRGSLEEKLAYAKHNYTEPLLLQICYMLDAARAVAYLHSFTPPFIHRDIKPANFLMDANNVVKLTDFGESRSMAVKMDHLQPTERGGRKMTMRGTPDYMAPEIIEGRNCEAVYSEMADIYSLAITFWEILHPGREKYPSTKNNTLNVYRLVLDGQRPPIDTELHPVFRDLLESAWCSSPEFRPSALSIVKHLENFQEEICGTVAQVLSRLVQYTVVTKTKRVSAKATRVTFTGEEAVRCLMEHNYAFEVEEALRLGNAIMDAGCLHHATHTKAFENSDQLYFFDETHIDLIQPLPCERTMRGSSNDESLPIIYISNPSHSETTQEDAAINERLYENGMCGCKKHAQGHFHTKPKATKKLFRWKKNQQTSNQLTVNLLHEMAGEDFGGFNNSTGPKPHLVVFINGDRSARRLMGRNFTVPMFLLNTTASNQEYLHRMYANVQLQAAISYTIMFILTASLNLYMITKRKSAYSGDTQAARQVILPTFRPLLCVLCFSLLVYSSVLWSNVAAECVQWLFTDIGGDAIYAGRQFIFLLILSYFYQRSLSNQALIRSAIIAFIVASTPVLLDYFGEVFDATRITMHYIQTVYRCLVTCAYLYMLIYPRSRATVWTLRVYCLYVLGGQILAFGFNDLYYHDIEHPDLVKPATILVVVASYYDTLLPLFVWALLRADTEHWRGLGRRACTLQSDFALDNQLSIQEVTSAHGLHLLIEMHRKHVIDFAHLNIIHKIGQGASAAIYSGKLHGKEQVAIKVYTPQEINEKVVAEFSQEAALCGALNHPNIATFYGMCVCPPTICLISELCVGSVSDYLLAKSRDSSHSVHEFSIQLCMILDAARAVAYLHSFTPPFIHRDIKPANLLIDINNVVKLTDFGDSRKCYSRQNDQHSVEDGNAMTVRGTVEFMAPEVIQGRAGLAQYCESVDIYSLAMTMWDILHPGQEKYPGAFHSHFKVFESVVNGRRPSLKSNIHPMLADIMQSAWCGNIKARPSASQIVIMLEAIQQDTLAELTIELSRVVTYVSTLGRNVGYFCFEGENMVESMMSLEWVSTPAEAVRIGNALLDAGFVHHSKHAKCFENTSSLYYFEAEAMAACTPLASTTDRTTSVTTNSENNENSCSCKILALKPRPSKSNVIRAPGMFAIKDQPLSFKLLDDDIQH
ncbi:kinase [Thraustotheca clavata]|uniref:Kinase n=1 Tax=Thraustotheca clavata TaxID=74557 RepID=A0A1V9Y6W2_9STRA|nr:kinase [Thraustotheca clavata]